MDNENGCKNSSSDINIHQNIRKFLIIHNKNQHQRPECLKKYPDCLKEEKDNTFNRLSLRTIKLQILHG